MDGKSMPDAPVSEKALSAAQTWWNGTEGLRYAEFPDLAQAFARFEGEARRETANACLKSVGAIADRWAPICGSTDESLAVRATAKLDAAEEIEKAIRAILDGEAG